MPRGAARILVVDDAAFTRQCVRKALAAAGYEVLEAASGEQAVDLYRALRSEVVLLEVVMPGMGGPAALTAIRELDGSARVIMLATPEQQPLALECLEAAPSTSCSRRSRPSVSSARHRRGVPQPAGKPAAVWAGRGVLRVPDPARASLGPRRRLSRSPHSSTTM